MRLTFWILFSFEEYKISIIIAGTISVKLYVYTTFIEILKPSEKSAMLTGHRFTTKIITTAP